MSLNIPASQIVSVNPGVISAGGSALDLLGLVLTNSTRVPIGTVQSFPTAAAVAAYFGAGTTEANYATTYFGGFDNSTVKPASILFTQYPWTSAVNPYLRGGNISGLTLTQLQALGSGTVIVTVNGVVKTSGSINLSGASSFSNAASLIQTGLAAYDAVVTGSISTTVLTVSAVSSGALAVGQVITGTGVTAGTTIVSLGTGTGGTGTYNVSVSQTTSSTTISAGQLTCTYDSTSGAFVLTGGTPGVTGTIGFATGTLSTGLLLTAATGAVTSQGAAIAVPGTFMDAVITQTQNWATFGTTFEPVTADCVLFSAWASGKANRYLYVLWDTDATVILPNPTTSAGYLIIAAGYSGTALVYAPTNQQSAAAFIQGAVASLDFTRNNGRANFAFRAQSGLVADVTSGTYSSQLLLNGYNFYGAYATANQGFTFLYNGSVTGPFLWLDDYVNEIWLNNALQLALMNLLTSVLSIPYNAAGYGLIAAACADPINAAVTFGAIRPGVVLSAAQAAEVNNAAGADISGTLSTRGWYLQVLPASPTVRAARTSPPITLWYVSGGSVNKITIASLEVQ